MEKFFAAASYKKVIFFISLTLISSLSFASQSSSVVNSTENSLSNFSELSTSSNPAAVNVNPGNGDLGHLFGLTDDSGIRLGGSWIADGDWLLTGGQNSQDLTGNNSIILGLTLDTQKLSWWDGGLFGVQMLQFNGMPSNTDAGTVQGFDSITGSPPLHRTELYQLWFRQALFENKLIFRIGKTAPTVNFNNVLRPVPLTDEALVIPSVSGLLFTPIFVNPTMLGLIPGYYNSAYGITSTFAPNEKFYISAGTYDGNLANGTQTGLVGPKFNGYYFSIAEMGYAWKAGTEQKPGLIAIGGWNQTGQLTTSNGVAENGAQGLYMFGSQRLWYRDPGVDISGISAYFQLGVNNSNTITANQYVGLGLTGFGLTRPKDSFGVGLATSWLNQNVVTRKNELMLQGYYQANLTSGLYLAPILTYIPTPGASANLPGTWAGSLQLIKLF